MTSPFQCKNVRCGPNPSLRPRAGFTIVEMLVIIGIIALLIAILLPALAAGRARAEKTDEINKIRQFHLAWVMYSNSHDDAALPGYIDEETQLLWDVVYRYPDKTDIPAQFAAPYTWRIFRYLEFSDKMVHGHLDEADPNVIAEANEIAYEPAFGYNAIYIGGWYELDPGDTIALPMFNADRVVAKSTAQVQQNNRMVLFCSSSVQPVGIYRKWDRTTPGSHYAVPPIVGTEQRWLSGLNGAVASAASTTGPAVAQAESASGGAPIDPGTVQVVDDSTTPVTSIPIGRYTGSVAVGWADGSTSSELPGALADQRLWINRANKINFTHGP